MSKRLLVTLQNFDPVIGVPSVHSVDLGENADGAPSFRIGFAGQTGCSLILNIV